MFRYKVVRAVQDALRTALDEGEGPSRHDIGWGVRNTSGYGSLPRITILTAYQGENAQQDSGFVPQLMLSVDIECPSNIRSEEQLWVDYVPKVVRVLQDHRLVVTQVMPLEVENKEQEALVCLRIAATAPATA